LLKAKDVICTIEDKRSFIKSHTKRVFSKNSATYWLNPKKIGGLMARSETGRQGGVSDGNSPMADSVSASG
jgi:hypothetical protein